MSLAVMIHILAAIVWIGGMFFALVVLRPAAGELDAPQRLALWGGVFARFFAWVWASVVLLPASGYWIAFESWGGLGAAPLHVHAMHALGWLMVVIFLHLWFAPYRRFKAALAGADHPVAAKNLNQIRWMVTANLAIGLFVAAIGAVGRYWS